MNRFKNIDEASVDSLDLDWDQLKLNKLLHNALKEEFKFATMTPVQAATIPLMMKGLDVIVEAKTGSGKTLAFLIPVIEAIIKLDVLTIINPFDVLAIILSPTRELATQIHQELRKIVKNPLLPGGRSIKSQLIVGGSSVATDIQKYSKFGANIIVATPGRLSSILEMADNKLSSCIRKKLVFLIFDEADQLLAIGFEKNLSSILAYLPKQRRTSLFSATQTTEVDELIKSGLRNPIRVNVNKSVYERDSSRSENDASKSLLMPNKLENFYLVCDSYGHKLATLISIIKTNKFKKVLVFFSTCSQIDYFSHCLNEELEDKKTTVLKLHRRLKNKRKAIFNNFKKSKHCILLVTDILSRGIDVPDISCVVHVDLPASPECYVHRSGRSGHQIELSGISLLMLENHELDYVEMCRRRQITFSPMDSAKSQAELSGTLTRILDRMNARALADPTFETLGIQAFVSYIRFYTSKLCLRQLLFPRLDVANLVKSFGLKRVPKMPELRKNHQAIVSKFTKSEKDVASIQIVKTDQTATIKC